MEIMKCVLLLILLYEATADDATMLGPEERKALIDDDIFLSFDEKPQKPDVRKRQRNCAQDYEDCDARSCCRDCTMCTCNTYGGNCRCNRRRELAMWLGVCKD